MPVQVSTAGEEPPPPPKPTGNLAQDVFTATTHITNYPCARNSLLTGIGGGVAFGFIRGMTAKSPIVAGNWAVGTFFLFSIGSWHLCKRQYQLEKEKVKVFMERNHGPHQKSQSVIKNPEELAELADS